MQNRIIRIFDFIRWYRSDEMKGLTNLRGVQRSALVKKRVIIGELWAAPWWARWILTGSSKEVVGPREVRAVGMINGIRAGRGTAPSKLQAGGNFLLGIKQRGFFRNTNAYRSPARIFKQENAMKRSPVYLNHIWFYTRPWISPGPPFCLYGGPVLNHSVRRLPFLPRHLVSFLKAFALYGLRGLASRTKQIIECNCDRAF